MAGRKATASPFSSRTDLSQQAQGTYISYGTMNNDGLVTAHSVQPPHGALQQSTAGIAAGAQGSLSGGSRNTATANNDYYEAMDKERRMPMSITVMEVPQEIRHKKSFLPFWQS